MARIRSIKPEHWSDPALPEVSLGAHLFWIGSWNYSDDLGIFDADFLYLRSKIFPRRKDVNDKKIRTWLKELTEAGFIIPFEYAGRSYFLTRTFLVHQRIDSPQPSKIPEEVVEKVKAEFLKRSKNNSGNDTGTFQENSALYRRGEDRIGERRGSGGGRPVTPKHFFYESEIFEKEKFSAALFGTEYQDANVDYYHASMDNWSRSKNEKRSDWLATVKNSMLRDMTLGRFVTGPLQNISNGQRTAGPYGGPGKRTIDSNLAFNLGGAKDGASEEGYPYGRAGL